MMRTPRTSDRSQAEEIEGKIDEPSPCPSVAARIRLNDVVPSGRTAHSQPSRFAVATGSPFNQSASRRYFAV
jgi:hypothetical protein